VSYEVGGGENGGEVAVGACGGGGNRRGRRCRRVRGGSIVLGGRGRERCWGMVRGGDTGGVGLGGTGIGGEVVGRVGWGVVWRSRGGRGGEEEVVNKRRSGVAGGKRVGGGSGGNGKGVGGC